VNEKKYEEKFNSLYMIALRYVGNHEEAMLFVSDIEEFLDWTEILNQIHDFVLSEAGSEVSANDVRVDVAEWLNVAGHIDTTEKEDEEKK